MKGRTVLLFIDSTTAENILVKGYSNGASDANGMVSEFWELASSLQILVYTDRVPTDMNPADGASRGTIEDDCLRYGWEHLRAELLPRWRKRGPGHLCLEEGKHKRRKPTSVNVGNSDC